MLYSPILAEALGGFEFLPEAEIFAFEHWPLERRKVDEEIDRERKALLLPRRIAVIIGGGSGIGEAAAHRFAEEGAHVVVADLDASRAEATAIRTALGRLEAGTYRRCVKCGHVIGAARLAALPSATTCVACASA